MVGSKSLFLLIVSIMASVLDGQTLRGPSHDKVVVCYVATWAAYRPGLGAYTIGDLNATLCTHLVYSFAGLDEATNTIKSLDPWQDLEKDYGKGGYKKLVAFKEEFPHLKVTIAIGGWNEGSLKYSKMAETPETREKFIQSVMTFLDNYKFDGLDLDWEYPTRRDGRPIDKANYVSLVKELKEAFEPYGYILTAALGAGKEIMEAAYDLAKLSRYLDFIHMMCYDYHGTWDGTVGANAPLKGSAEQDVLSVEFTIKYMLAHGVSPYKMVLGLPMYGRNFILTDPSTKTIEFGKTPVKGQGFMGPWTKEAGFMGYNEVCSELSSDHSNWTRHWHQQSATPYLRGGDRIVTYDDTRSIAIKVKMAMDYGLGGLMVWSIDTDDFKGICKPETDTYMDFVERYNKIADEPILDDALKGLGLPDMNRREHLNRKSFYVTVDGKLHLRLPEPQAADYSLMRTINDATTLALEEKRIIDEIERVTKENEIEDVVKDEKGAASRVVKSTLLTLLLVLILL